MTFFNDKVRFYSGVPGRYKNDMLGLIVPRNQEQETFRGLLRKLVNHEFWCLTVLGTVGNGKTTLACATVNAWNNDNSFYEDGAYYVTQSELMSQFKDGFNGGRSEAQVFNQYGRKARLLVIDELNPGDWSEYNKATIQRILVERYANNRLTVLIGNLTTNELKTMFDPHVISRLREGETLYMTAKDMRVKGDNK